MDKIDFSMTVSTLKVSLLTHQNVLDGFYDNHLTGRNKKEYIVCVKICFTSYGEVKGVVFIIAWCTFSYNFGEPDEFCTIYKLLVENFSIYSLSTILRSVHFRIF